MKVAIIYMIRPNQNAAAGPRTVQLQYETLMRSSVGVPLQLVYGSDFTRPYAIQKGVRIAAYRGMKLGVGDYISAGRNFSVAVMSGDVSYTVVAGHWARVHGSEDIRHDEIPETPGLTRGGASISPYGTYTVAGAGGSGRNPEPPK